MMIHPRSHVGNRLSRKHNHFHARIQLIGWMCGDECLENVVELAEDFRCMLAGDGIVHVEINDGLVEVAGSLFLLIKN